jgi:hypothetical protein
MEEGKERMSNLDTQHSADLHCCEGETGSGILILNRQCYTIAKLWARVGVSLFPRVICLRPAKVAFQAFGNEVAKFLLWWLHQEMPGFAIHC